MKNLLSQKIKVNSLSEKWRSKYLENPYFKNLQEANENDGNYVKSKSPTKSTIRNLDSELSNQNQAYKRAKNGENSTVGRENQISPKKQHTLINPSEEDTQSILSTITKFTENTLGKETPRKINEDDQRYITRYSIRENKRLFGPRIKIQESKNEIKYFNKRRMITTDFEFNPRFDSNKMMKRTVKVIEPFKYPGKWSSFHMCLRKRDVKAVVVKEREIRKQTPGILKPNPLKAKFW